MSFSVLPPEIKVKIFEMLDLGSRCNACLVWEEMTDETMKSIPSELVEELEMFVENINNLEIAGFLALHGRLDSVKYLWLTGVDLKTMPSNIFYSVARIVKNQIRLDDVTGLCWSMLENIKCEGLYLERTLPSSPASTSQNNIFFDKVRLWYKRRADDDISGLLDNITCKRLDIHNMLLNNAETWSLTKMLSNRVETLGKG